MEENDLNESVNVTELSPNDDDELMIINNNQTVLRGRNGSFTSRTFTSRTNGPSISSTTGSTNPRTTGSTTNPRTNGPPISYTTGSTTNPRINGPPISYTTGSTTNPRTNGPPISYTTGSTTNPRINGPPISYTNGSTISHTNESIVLERGVRGKVITINRSKHYSFLKRSDNVESKDIFAREVSVVNPSRQQKFFINDMCKFDIIHTRRGLEAINISIEERHINSIAKLPKIPKKSETYNQSQVSADFFKSTITDLFKEVLRKR